VGVIVAYTQLNKVADSLDVSSSTLGVTLLHDTALHTIKMSEIFMNNPEMRDFFYEGKDITETNPLYLKAKSLAYLMLDFFDVTRPMALRASTLPDPIIDPVSWDNYFTTTFKNSPLLCRLYLESKDQYGTAIRAIAIPSCTDLSEPIKVALFAKHRSRFAKHCLVTYIRRDGPEKRRYRR
jgi:hypothetical protein